MVLRAYRTSPENLIPLMGDFFFFFLMKKLSEIFGDLREMMFILELPLNILVNILISSFFRCS